MTNFYEYFRALLFGVVQGITEFLPISSTAHLNLLNNILGNSKHLSIFFETFLHLGSLIILLFYYRKIIIFIISNFYKNPVALKAAFNILLGFIPLLIIGGLFGSQLKELFNEQTIKYSLIIGGIALIIINFKYNIITQKQSDIEIVSNINYKQALIIGFAQTLAIIPGVSRSGATISAGLLTGLSTKQAFNFSFILALPTMVAASVYGLMKSINHLPSAQDINLSLIGLLGTAIFSFITFKLAQKFISNNKHALTYLGIYRIFFGLII